MEEGGVGDVGVEEGECRVERGLGRGLVWLGKGRLRGREMVWMGDDDFVRVGMGFVVKEVYGGGRMWGREMDVVEMEGGYMECVEGVGGGLGVGISCEGVDLRMGVGGDLWGGLEWVLRDGGYREEGGWLLV